MRRRLLIFDLDGTLVDSAEAICWTFQQVLEQNGIPPVPEEKLRSWIGRPLAEMFQWAAAGLPVSIPQLVQEYRRLSLPHSLPRFRPLPGVRRVLPSLQRVAEMAIATSRTAEGTRLILEHLKMSSHFSVIVGIETVSRPKPHPEAIWSVLREFPPGVEALMVGDTEDDMAAGRAAGLTSVGVTTGTRSAEQLYEAGADHVIEGLGELPRLLTGFPQQRKGGGG